MNGTTTVTTETDDSQPTTPLNSPSLSALGDADAEQLGDTCRSFARRRSLLIVPSGVLYDDTLWWRWLLQLVGRMGLHTHREAFWQVWRRDYYDAVCQGRRTHWEALQHFLLAAGLSRGQIDEVCAAGRPRWRLFDEQLRPFPHVPAALDALHRAGYAVSVLAHVPQPGDELAKRYEQMGLGGRLQAVFTSGDLGCGPGDANYVRLALSRLDWSAAATTLVTHESIRLDNDSAQALAVANIALDCAEADRPEWHFECLTELAARLLRSSDRCAA